MEINSVTFSRLLLDTKDGDWGRGEAGQGFLPYRVIRGTDFADASSGDLSNIPIRYLAESSAQRRTLRPDDIIIETAGGSNDRPTGRTFLVKKKLVEQSGLPLTCASFCRFLRVDPELADPRYVYWYLQYLYAKGDMWIHQVKHTGIARFQYTRFASTVQVPLPSSSEQQAIAHILGSLDDKIQLNRQMNETLEGITRALFKSWFVDFDPVRAKMEGRQPYGMDAGTAALFPDGFEDSVLGEIPRGWQVGEINDLGEIICGKTPSTSDPENYGDEIPFITIPDMHGKVFITQTSKKLSLKGAQLQNNKTIPSHSICVSCIASPGIVALAAQTAQTNQQINSVIPKSETFSYYCYGMLRGLSEEIRARAAGGSVTLNLSRGQFVLIPVLLAPEEIVSAYHQSVKPFFEKILSNDLQNQTLASLRDTLLPKLLSGEIRVKDAEKTVEAVM
jgi:type I restriction enzyme, S subunit